MWGFQTFYTLEVHTDEAIILIPQDRGNTAVSGQVPNILMFPVAPPVLDLSLIHISVPSTKLVSAGYDEEEARAAPRLAPVVSSPPLSAPTLSLIHI